MKSTFPDHFSASASGYASFRPSYPAALFQWLAGQCAEHRRVWDCATGSGQAAVHLAHHFTHVIATDPSESQIKHATQVPGVHYGVMTAESTGLSERSIDLVTVAQALHWFDLPRFYDEVRRVLIPRGLLCVWTYGLLSISPEIDTLVDDFYRNRVGAYWPAERALVDRGYAGIEFPFEGISAPSFEMVAEWTLKQLGGYLETWSAVSRYRRALGQSPVPEFIRTLAPVWGEPTRYRPVRWQLELLAGRVDP